MNIKKLLVVTAVVFQLGYSVSAQSPNELAAEISEIDKQLDEVANTIELYDGGLIKAMAELRRESLLLSRTLLSNRILAIDGGERIEVAVPAVQPDEEKANELLGEIADALKRIEEAEIEAEAVGGLIQALALSRVETEKLTLAQLQMAFYQAKYGIAFPATSPAQPTSNTEYTVSSNPSLPEANQSDDTDQPSWADQRYPHVDYSLAPFMIAYGDENKAISGWWITDIDRAAIDDSLKITSINYSRYSSRGYSDLTALFARCSEGKTAFIFLQDDYLIADYRRNHFDITYRIDELSAVQTRWSSLTSNKGAGLFGAGAESFIREIYDAEQLFIRLTEKNGERHDVTFDLSGGQDAFDSVASACGWTTLSLTTDDYRTIQSLLNAGGFDVGTPDGVWGAGSQRGMKAFQASVGLEETGAPSRETLAQLGLD